MTRSAVRTGATAVLRRAGGPAAGLAAAGLLAAGCSSPGPRVAGSGLRPSTSSPPHVRQYLPHTSAPARSRSAGPATRSPAPASGSGGTGPATEPVTEPAAAGPVACPASGLRVTIGPPDSAAGSSYYPLDFTNVSQLTCTLYGFPGVWFAAADGGATIGQGAVRNPAFAPSLVTLTAGATVHADLQVQVAQSYPAKLCKPVTAHWLKVYPPASYVPAYVSFTAVTCTGHVPSGNTLGIYVVRPGVTGP